jgi:secretion/DNA translocation related TadE-like protein
MSGRERGSVTVFAIAAIALAVVLMTGVARVGGAAVRKARADSAADAAALAAADALALGQGPAAAEAAAASIAVANGARLVSCDCMGSAAEVVVAIAPGRAVGRARAEIDVGKSLVSSP